MKRGICKEPRYTHRSPRIKRLSRETIREQLARMIHDARRANERERKRELTGSAGVWRERGESAERTRRNGGERERKRGGRRRKRLPTVYTYIMQMVPIISEVYNRSINLLTGRKGSGGVVQGHVHEWGVVHQHRRYLRRHGAHLLTPAHHHRQMYLVSIPFVCMGFCVL